VTDELRELDARLADPAFYHSGSEDEVAKVLKRRGELAQQVDTLEARWLKLQEELETIA
jgi:ATP-binding cassette subfamily F protein 3